MPSNRIDTKQVRRFGIVAVCFFGLLTGLALYHHKTVLPIVFGLLFLSGAACTLVPQRTAWIHRGWMRLAQLVSMVVTYTLLILSYYLLITPTAILLRVFGKEIIPKRPDPNAETYWRDRKEPLQPIERYTKRY